MDLTLSRELLQAALGGDKVAFNEVGEWIADQLIDFYTAQGRPIEEVSELGQKAALDIVNKFQQAPDDPELFLAWVESFAVVAGKNYRTRAQRFARKQAAARVYPRTPLRPPDSQLGFQRLLAWVREELQGLSSPYRSTFMLMLTRDSHKQVADELDVPEATVKRRVWKARRDLKSALNKRHQS